jgi:hypothetical protein
VLATIAEEPKQAFSSSNNLGCHSAFTYCDPLSKNGGKSSSTRLRKQKRILLG